VCQGSRKDVQEVKDHLQDRGQNPVNKDTLQCNQSQLRRHRVALCHRECQFVTIQSPRVDCQ